MQIYIKGMTILDLNAAFPHVDMVREIVSTARIPTLSSLQEVNR